MVLFVLGTGTSTVTTVTLCRTSRDYHSSLIRSKLDYGCVVYGSARPSYLRMLDPIQNHALRLCLGAFRTSPCPSLSVEANEPPLNLRLQKLSLQYALRLSSNYQNPAYNVVFNTKFGRFF